MGRGTLISQAARLIPAQAQEFALGFERIPAIIEANVGFKDFRSLRCAHGRQPQTYLLFIRYEKLDFNFQIARVCPH